MFDCKFFRGNSVRGLSSLFKSAVYSTIIALIIVGWARLSQAAVTTQPFSSEAPCTDNPLVKQIKKKAPVRKSMIRRGAVSAKLYPNTILRVCFRGASSSCPQGWYERLGGGFICGKFLRDPKDGGTTTDGSTATTETEERGAFWAVRVQTQDVAIFSKIKNIDQRIPHLRLRKGSILSIEERVERNGIEYYRTSDGWYIKTSKTEPLPPPLERLGVDIEPGKSLPGAIVVGDNAKRFSEPDENSPSLGRLERWSIIPRIAGEPIVAENGWVRLEEAGGYARDEDLARLRPPPKPKRLAPDERWLSVDLEEQLFHAYKGEQLVRVIPCSTGKRGNTAPGRYRLQWKLRKQTMRLRQGAFRVENVDWVMYYDMENGIAIHTAYWHQDFGQPVSHGCVNLPLEDARWVYEWTHPLVLPEDSERFPVPGEPGSRVVVF